MSSNNSTEPVSNEHAVQHKHWSQRAQNVAAVLWASFLAACIATLLFFALVDPALLGDAMSPPMSFARMTGYAFGFFFFWVVTTISSVLSVYLVYTRSNAS